MSSEKKAYIEGLRSDISAWEQKIAQLKSESHRVEHQSGIEFGRQMDMLEAKLDLLKNHIEQLQQADGRTWEEIKIDVDKSLHEMKDAFDSAFSKLS